MGLAALFLSGEIFHKGSYFLWLSLGAALSGIMSLLEIPAAGQAAVFINVSGILIVLERRFNERYTFKQPEKIIEPILYHEEENYIFRKTGSGWEIRYAGQSYIMKHCMGLIHIKNLIKHTGKWLRCTELKRLASENLVESRYQPYSKMTGERLDEENLRRSEDIHPEDIISHLSLNELRRLRDELEDRKNAENFESPEDRIDQLDLLKKIEKYLSSITDHRGHPRKLIDETETDRKAVSAAINRCLRSMSEHKELHTHFKSFIHAEHSSYQYLPDRFIEWQTE